MDPVPGPAPTGLAGRALATHAFFRGVRGELEKVTWPSRGELIKATRMIIILSLVLGVAIGLVDFLLQRIFVSGVAALSR